MGAGSLRQLALIGTGIDSTDYLVPTNSATIILNGPTLQIGYKFFATSTMTVSAVDVNLGVTGVVTGHTYTLEIQTDSSDSPSGSLVGTATSAFAGPAAAGVLGAKTLGSNAALTINTPYWVVLKCASGTPDGSNFLSARDLGTSSQKNGQKLRQHNGTNWTTTTAVARAGCMVLTLTGSEFYGLPITAARAASGLTKVFGTNRQAISFKIGADTTIPGVYLRLVKTGTPADLEVLIYEGSTLKATQQIPVANITTDTPFYVGFTTPPTVSSGVKSYIVLRALADGGTSGNAWDFYCHAFTAAYALAALPVDVEVSSGTGNDPTAYTAAAGLLALSGLVLTAPATEIVGGGTVINNTYTYAVMD